jgi:peptidyl-dipeptidase Dcp
MIAAVAGPNPLLEEWDTGAPPFDRIHADQFLPALEVALAESLSDVQAISKNDAPPSFDNSVAALERSGTTLARVRRLFWALASVHADDSIKAIESEISAMLSRHASAINHDQMLFARIAAVWGERQLLDPEQRRLTENSYKGFVRGGAALPLQKRAELAALDERLASLSVLFGQNVLAANSEWEMLLEQTDLTGLPESLRESAGRRAAARAHKQRYLFTLDRSDVEPFLAFSERRDLRERIWRAFTSRCEGDVHDNRGVAAEIIRLRAQKADMLGYPSYAHYALEDSMAKTPASAEALLMRVWAPAREQAIQERASLQASADADASGLTIEPWDWRFYEERVRRERFSIDDAAIRDHLKLVEVRNAAFEAAGRLYGLRFMARTDVPTYHVDVDAWEVRGSGDEPVGLLYTDYFARREKHGGAWMGSLRVQEKMDGVVRPIVYTVANFARAADPSETRISLDEARTLFHEFGHALHALLSDVTYPSLAGTAVVRDFVEFPSKFMEHWIVAPQLLRSFGMEEELVRSISRSNEFGQGFATVEFVAAAILDLALHRETNAVDDVVAFEQSVLDKIGMPPGIVPRYSLAHFGHIFDGGYASAYYSYLWSEVLDEDAFEAFCERGDIFDAELAERFRSEILARGDSRDPLASFMAFRGRPPKEDALLRARGLSRWHGTSSSGKVARNR